MTIYHTEGNIRAQGRFKDGPRKSMEIQGGKTTDKGFSVGFLSTELKLNGFVTLTPEFCKYWLEEIKLCAAMAPVPEGRAALVAIAAALDEGARADIWYDAHAHDDAEGQLKIDNAQQAMTDAAEALRNMAAPAPIGITLEGGMIQSIFSFAPESCPAVYVIDHDVEGADVEDTSPLPGGKHRAIVSKYQQPEQAESAAWFAELDKGFDATEGRTNG